MIDYLSIHSTMIDTQLKNKTKIDNNNNNKNNKMMINCIDHCYKCNKNNNNSLSLTSKNKRKQVIKSDLNNYNSVSRKLTLKARAIARKKTKTKTKKRKDKDQAIMTIFTVWRCWQYDICHLILTDLESTARLIIRIGLWNILLMAYLSNSR